MKKRLIEFLAYLRIGQLKFEENAGLSRGYVNKIGDNITLKSLDRISAAYPELNTAWLLTGEGSMLKTPQNINSIGRDVIGSTVQQRSGNINVSGNNNISNSNNSAIVTEGRMLKHGYSIEEISQPINKGVPYYDVDFIGGFDLIHNDQTTQPAYYIDFEQYNKADCWCNVTGHSMEPIISNGDIIALKEISDWFDFLPFGEIYAIVTTEHRTIKRISRASNNDNLLLIPTNESPEYQPQEIPKRLIMKVFKVLGCVKKF